MLEVIATSVLIFTCIILLLTFIIIYAERRLISQGKVKLKINNTKMLEVFPGGTLLSVLANHKIFVPSACGGGGTCAMCRCKVLFGAGEILSTEKAHISRRDAKNFIRLACQVKVRNDMEVTVPDEIFSIKQYTGTVYNNENVATFIKYLQLNIDNDDILDFKAGGYIQITVPPGSYDFNNFNIDQDYKSDWDKLKLWKHCVKIDKPISRAYSMANHPAEGNKVALTVRIATPPQYKLNLPPGICSSYIFGLKKGDSVSFSGPYGEFFIKNSVREKIYIGGGAGMAPMRSHLFHLFHTMKTSNKVSFFYGARSMKENFFEDDFKYIESKFSNFNYVLALSDPMIQDKWKGPTGFIHEVAYENYLKNHEDPTEIEYYLCGPPMMIDAVVNMLYNLGVDEEMIAFDKF